MQEPRANSYDTKLKSHTGHTGARKTLQHPCSCNVPETIIYFPFTEGFFALHVINKFTLSAKHIDQLILRSTSLELWMGMQIS